MSSLVDRVKALSPLTADSVMALLSDEQGLTLAYELLDSYEGYDHAVLVGLAETFVRRRSDEDKGKLVGIVQNKGAFTPSRGNALWILMYINFHGYAYLVEQILQDKDRSVVPMALRIIGQFHLPFSGFLLQYGREALELRHDTQVKLVITSSHELLSIWLPDNWKEVIELWGSVLRLDNREVVESAVLACVQLHREYADQTLRNEVAAVVRDALAARKRKGYQGLVASLLWLEIIPEKSALRTLMYMLGWSPQS